MKRLLVFGAIASALVLAVYTYARWIEPDRIVVDHVTLEVPDLDPAFASLRVVVIADLHIESVGRRERRLIETVNRLEPDILLMLGDFVQNAYWMTDYMVYVANACSVMTRMPARLATYAVFGNNDEPDVMVEPLRRAGVKVLENETVDLVLEGARLRLGGLGDPVTDRDDWGALLETGRPGLLMAHSPDAFARAAAEGIPVVLAGHTHGGRCATPGPLGSRALSSAEARHAALPRGPL